MDTTSRPNLKPFRQYSEHEVINGLFAATGVLNKGTVVTITTASGNTNVLQSGNSPVTPHLGIVSSWGEAPSYARSNRHEVKWKVGAAGASDVVLGITLRDTKETNKYGENYAYRPQYEKDEKGIVASGESVPILTRGIILTNGFTGTAAVNSGATPSGGYLVVAAYSKATSLGKFLTNADADGYALFKLEL